MNKKALVTIFAAGALVLSGFGTVKNISQAEAKNATYSVVVPAFGDGYTQDSYLIENGKSIKTTLTSAKDNEGVNHDVDMLAVKASAIDTTAPGASWRGVSAGQTVTLWDNNTGNSYTVKIDMDTAVFEYVTANGTMYWNY